MKKCFVVQRFDGGRYDQLFREVFSPAIKRAGFEPYRVDQDPSASIPIETIEREITDSDACFVEISEDNPNVWFELGYAIAKEKPLCLVCSKTRKNFPFDVHHRQIITYPEYSAPSDFDTLREKISGRLKSLDSNEVSLIRQASVAKALSNAPSTSGLRPHELLALTIIFQTQYTGGISAWSLGQDMERGGYTGVAAGLAIAGLKREALIKANSATDGNDDEYILFSVTSVGEEWLMEHQDELNLQSSSRADAGITDDDIPF